MSSRSKLLLASIFYKRFFSKLKLIITNFEIEFYKLKLPISCEGTQFSKNGCVEMSSSNEVGEVPGFRISFLLVNLFKYSNS